MLVLFHYNLNIPAFQNILYWIMWIASLWEIFFQIFPNFTQVQKQNNSFLFICIFQKISTRKYFTHGNFYSSSCSSSMCQWNNGASEFLVLTASYFYCQSSVQFLGLFVYFFTEAMIPLGHILIITFYYKSNGSSSWPW